MTTQPALPQDAGAAAALRSLSHLVVKQGVGLHGLPAPQLALALGLVWAGLPAEALMTEPQMNARLQQQLAGPAAFIETDHVALRRWLVDAGWITRDGYGRAYRRTAVAGLDAAQSALGQALSLAFADVDSTRWVAELLQARQAARLARRDAWQGGAGRTD